MEWNISKWSRMIPDGLVVSRWSGMFSDGLKYFKVICKGVKYTGKFPDSFNSGPKKTIRKVSRWPGKFPDGLEIFQFA